MTSRVGEGSNGMKSLAARGFVYPATLRSPALQRYEQFSSFACQLHWTQFSERVKMLSPMRPLAFVLAAASLAVAQTPDGFEPAVSQQLIVRFNETEVNPAGVTLPKDCMFLFLSRFRMAVDTFEQRADDRSDADTA